MDEMQKPNLRNLAAKRCLTIVNPIPGEMIYFNFISTHFFSNGLYHPPTSDESGKRKEKGVQPQPEFVAFIRI